MAFIFSNLFQLVSYLIQLCYKWQGFILFYSEKQRIYNSKSKNISGCQGLGRGREDRILER